MNFQQIAISSLWSILELSGHNKYFNIVYHSRDCNFYLDPGVRFTVRQTHHDNNCPWSEFSSFFILSRLYLAFKQNSPGLYIKSESVLIQ